MANKTKKTAARIKTFLEALDHRKGNVSAACEAIGIGRTAAYTWRKDDPDFAERWNDIVDKHMDALEAKIYERAFDGWQEPVFYQGKECGTVTKFSDSDAQFILRANRPEKYRDNSKIELGGLGGGPVQIEWIDVIEKPSEQENDE